MAKHNQPKSRCVVFDDDPDAVNLVRKRLANAPDPIMWMSDAPQDPADVCSDIKVLQTDLPDVVLVDIFLKLGEDRILNCDRRAPSFYRELAQVSGIRLVAELRRVLPRLPVVVWSRYWYSHPKNPEEMTLPDLRQHALAFIEYNPPADYSPGRSAEESIPQTLWLAHQAIIGVFMPKGDTLPWDATCDVIRRLNNAQHHFFFRMCRDPIEISDLPQDARPDLPEHVGRLFDVWNNRIVAIVDVLSEGNEMINQGWPVLPFCRKQPMHFQSRLERYIRFMGSDFLDPFLMRECCRTAYRVFFKFPEHAVASGKCIMDSSTYAPDLLAGMKQGLCEECARRLRGSHADGGWSRQRGEAVKRMVAIMQASV